MNFCASEFHIFFGHLGNCITTFQSHGKIPPSIFKSSGQPGSASAKGDKPKGKRKPTAFNFFVKEKLEELKQAGVTFDGDKNNNQLFRVAVDKWKVLSEQEKADYSAKYKVSHRRTISPQPDELHSALLSD